MTGVDGESDQVRDTVRDLKAIAGAIGNLDRKIAGVSLSFHQAVQEVKKIIDDDGRRTASRGGSDRSWFHGDNNRYGGSDSLIAKFERNLPEFDGFWHIDDLTSWIEAIEDFFEEISPSEHLKCKIVWCKMKGAAYYWWKVLQRDRIICGKEEITSWPRMKKLLFNKFSPSKCSTKFPNQLSNQEEGEEVAGQSMVGTSTPTKCSNKLPNNGQREKCGYNLLDGYSKEKEMTVVKHTPCVMKFLKSSSQEQDVEVKLPLTSIIVTGVLRKPTTAQRHVSQKVVDELKINIVCNGTVKAFEGSSPSSLCGFEFMTSGFLHLNFDPGGEWKLESNVTILLRKSEFLFYFASLEVSDLKPLNSYYGGQISVWGFNLLGKLECARLFVVGSDNMGLISSDLVDGLKNGRGAEQNPGTKVDPDLIEKPEKEVSIVQQTKAKEQRVNEMLGAAMDIYDVQLGEDFIVMGALVKQVEFHEHAILCVSKCSITVDNSKLRAACGKNHMTFEGLCYGHDFMSYGECMVSNDHIAKVAMFLFDPGGYSRSLVFIFFSLHNRLAGILTNILISNFHPNGATNAATREINMVVLLCFFDGHNRRIDGWNYNMRIGIKEAVRTQQPCRVVVFGEEDTVRLVMYRVFGRALDCRWLTDEQNCTIDFTKSLVILTTSLRFNDPPSGLLGKATSVPTRESMMQEVREHFMLRLLGSIDEVSLFNPPSYGQMISVYHLQLHRVAELLIDTDTTLALTDAVLDVVTSQSYNHLYRARPNGDRWLGSWVKVGKWESRMLLIIYYLLRNRVVAEKSLVEVSKLTVLNGSFIILSDAHIRILGHGALNFTCLEDIIVVQLLILLFSYGMYIISASNLQDSLRNTSLYDLTPNLYGNQEKCSLELLQTPVDCLIEDVDIEGLVISSTYGHLFGLKNTLGQGCTHGWDKMMETDVSHQILIYMVHWMIVCELFLFFSDPRNHIFYITRGQVILWEGWKDDVNESNTEGKFIVSNLSVVTISSCFKILFEERRFNKTLKLFHSVVNGLDPPMKIDGVCWVFQWIGSCPGLSMLLTLVVTGLLTNQHLVKFNSRTSLLFGEGWR